MVLCYGKTWNASAAETCPLSRSISHITPFSSSISLKKHTDIHMIALECLLKLTPSAEVFVLAVIFLPDPQRVFREGPSQVFLGLQFSVAPADGDGNLVARTGFFIGQCHFHQLHQFAQEPVYLYWSIWCNFGGVFKKICSITALYGSLNCPPVVTPGSFIAVV